METQRVLTEERTGDLPCDTESLNNAVKHAEGLIQVEIQYTNNGLMIEGLITAGF